LAQGGVPLERGSKVLPMRWALGITCAQGFLTANDAPAPQRRLEDLTCNGAEREVSACGQSPCAEERDCSATDAYWGEWSAWNDCSCALSMQERHRLVLQHAECGGKEVTGPSVQAQSCTPPCAQVKTDCQFADWADWAECDKPCGTGQRSRERAIAAMSVACGDACEGNLKESQA